MTALADTPVRLSKKARRRLAAVPRIPDHRDLNPPHPLPPGKVQGQGSSSHPLPPGRGQGEGPSVSPLPSPPPPGGAVVPPASPLLPSSESPSTLCALSASAVKTLPPPSSESPASLSALCASAVKSLPSGFLPDYLSANFSLPALAERHNLSLLELIDLLDSPQFIALLDRLNSIAERRAATIALHARPGALAGLESVITTTTSPETARKAAATLIRASDRVLTPRRAQPRTSAEQPDAQPPTPNLDLGQTPPDPDSPGGAGFQPASQESSVALAP